MAGAFQQLQLGYLEASPMLNRPECALTRKRATTATFVPTDVSGESTASMSTYSLLQTILQMVTTAQRRCLSVSTCYSTDDTDEGECPEFPYPFHQNPEFR